VGLSVGLLSTADINAKLIAGARESGVAEITAVASRDGERARAYADQNGIERAHGSYEELLADREVDAVYISLPNAMHVEWAIKALQAGKHVLCEKPLTRDPAEAEHAFDAAEAADRVLMEAFMWRYTPQAERLVELTAELGELRLVRSQFSYPEPEGGNVRLSGSLEGGALMDVGCYCVSGARLVTGSEPEHVTAQCVHGGEGVDVAFTATMRFPGDVLAHFDCAMSMVDRAELEVVGTEGTLLLGDPWHSREPVIEHTDANGDVERIECEVRDPYACELSELAAVVAGEREARFGRADAVGQSRALAALHDAA
jgi:xylose dehydrogenase (NAD/NADP)